MTNTSPDHTTLSKSLDLLHIHQSTSEIYGLLCAIISAHAAITKDAWVNGLMTLDLDKKGNTKEIDSAKKDLENLFTWTQNYLNTEAGPEFHLILPDPKAEFESTLRSLIEFSQGFLSGLNLCQINTETQKDNPPLQEALESLTQIACLDDNEEDSSSNQEALELCTNYTKDTTSVILKHLKLNAPSDTKN
jgi:uncharacterized protein YgfB (UPF0149 family)